MGREVRRVPPNWNHPKCDRYGDDRLQPMYDERYEDASLEWRSSYARWEAGEKMEHREDDGSLLDFWEYRGNPPDRKYYRPWRDDEATWFQLWETVSEGTPVSPPFATAEELAAHLAEHGDDWDQHRGHGGWGKVRADAFVKAGWAPSMMIKRGVIFESKDIPLETAK